MFKVNKYSLFIFLICILLLGTLVQTILPFNLNRIIGAALFALVFFWLMREKNNFYIVTFSILSVIISFLMTSDIVTNLSNSIYWLIAIWLIYISNNSIFQKKMVLAFNRNRKLIYTTIVIADLILLFSLINENGYKVSITERYFIGFTVHQHTMASAACFIMCLVLVDLCDFNIKLEKAKFPIKHFLLMMPAIVAVLQSSARVFLIPATIIIMYFYLYKINRLSVKLLVFPLVIIILGYLLINSNVFTRIINVSGTDSESYTSGRTVFWVEDMVAFLQSNFVNKIFGHGFEYIQIINLKLTNVAIGAHNDYITLLLGLGLLGTFLYIWVLFREIKFNLCLNSLIKEVMLFAFWFIPSFVNGFYGYQLLLYGYIYLKIVFLNDCNINNFIN